MYPLHRVWEEAELIRQHQNVLLATDAVLVQMAIASIFSKDGRAEFNQAVTKMTDQ